MVREAETAALGTNLAEHRRQGNQQSGQGRQTVELLIKTEAGKLLNVVQEQDPALTFAKGDRVRILTTGADTRVDKSV